MDNLVGRRFSLDDTDYAIVDVRNIQGDTLVYAEPTKDGAKTGKGPGRAAFRYADIESQLDAPSAESA